MRYSEWKTAELQDVHETLRLMGYTDTGQSFIKDMLESLMDTAYDKGQEDALPDG